MNRKTYLLISALCLSFQLPMHAQSSFATIEYLDVNNIKAAALVHGDFWNNPTTHTPSCEYPKGSGKPVAYLSSLWLSGYDSGNNLHVAAQGYRQTGNDFWPGPLDNFGATDPATVNNWAKIWKINRTTIDSFRQLASHTVSNTPTSILEWPAKGNPYAKGNGGVTLTITNDMAPFVDVNGDNIYNPLQGDYPLIKGDQMLWLVYNDNAWAHGNSHGVPFGVEVQVSAFGYKRGTNIDNILYYDFKLINKSNTDYSNFRLGISADMDLGYTFDDYIGYDSVHRMGIVYNGKNIDGNGEPTSYGNSIPIAGVSMINLPGDVSGSPVRVGCFNSFTNGSPISGDPTTPEEFNNYMRSRNKVGTHIYNPLTNDSVDYLYPDDPSNHTGWSECAVGNQPGDRRFVISSNDFSLESKTNKTLTIALVVQPPSTSNACPNAMFTHIKDLADTAAIAYSTPPLLSAAQVNAQQSSIEIYPNPTNQKLYVTTPVNSNNVSITIYDALGRTMNIPSMQHNNKMEVDVRSLPTGIYTLIYRSDDAVISKRFVKE